MFPHSIYMSLQNRKSVLDRMVAHVLILLPFLAVNFLHAHGGYQIAARYGGSYRFQSADVWNIDLQYAGSKPVGAYLQATIADVKGRKLVELTTETLLLQPGANSLLAATTATRVQRYFLQGLPELEQAYGSLPAGSYTVCYQAFCATPDCDGAGQAALYNEFPQCVQVTVEPPTPLLLAWPEDGAETDSRRPAFSWIPPMPLAQVPGFTYTHTLYQASKGQTCNEAALRNPPMYRADAQDQPSMPYPHELDDLDTGKTYCWKVDGMLSGVQVAQSEVWRLKVRVEKPQIRKTSTIMPELTPSTEPYIVPAGDTLVIVFAEDYQSTGLTWTATLMLEGTGGETDFSRIVLTPRFTGSGNIYLLPADMADVKLKRSYLLSIQNAKMDAYKARIIFK